jgi:hypothetical protein
VKWELYLSHGEWKEIKAAVRDRAPKDKQGKPCCERCGKVNGKLKRSKRGYLVPHWLHTAHRHGAPMQSKDPDDYLALCDACHMWYDRQPDESGWVPPYRQGYQATTTTDLVIGLQAVGLTLWQEGMCWYWRISEMSGGPEITPVQAVGAAIARLERKVMPLARGSSAEPGDHAATRWVAGCPDLQ